MKKDQIYFKEEQKFNQWWAKLVLYGSSVVSLGPLYYGTIMQLSTGVPWGDKPMSNTGLIVMDVIITTIMAGVIWLVFGTKLITIIKQGGIYVRFKPFLYKEVFIPFESIENYEVRKYSPVKDYGGWGVRYGRQGKAYNVSGNIGLQLWLKGNKRLLIGTQRPEAVKRAMGKMKSKNERG